MYMVFALASNGVRRPKGVFCCFPQLWKHVEHVEAPSPEELVLFDAVKDALGTTSPAQLQEMGKQVPSWPALCLSNPQKRQQLCFTVYNQTMIACVSYISPSLHLQTSNPTHVHCCDNPHHWSMCCHTLCPTPLEPLLVLVLTICHHSCGNNCCRQEASLMSTCWVPEQCCSEGFPSLTPKPVKHSSRAWGLRPASMNLTDRAGVRCAGGHQLGLTAASVQHLQVQAGAQPPASFPHLWQQSQAMHCSPVEGDKVSACCCCCRCSAWMQQPTSHQGSCWTFITRCATTLSPTGRSS